MSPDNLPEPLAPSNAQASSAETILESQDGSRAKAKPALLHRPAVLNGLLILLISLMVWRTLYSDRTELQRYGASGRNRLMENALYQTKIVYDPGLILQKPSSVRPPRSSLKQEDAVLLAWQKLTRNTTERAAGLRRLGITLALFHRPGALQTLLQAAQATKPPPGSSLGSKGRIDRSNGRISSLSPDEESACWKAIYGRSKLSAKELPIRRSQLARLTLGWFENIAAAQLALRAGQAVQARQAAEKANRSSVTLRQLVSLQASIFFGGLFALFWLSITALFRNMKTQFTPQDPRYESSLPPSSQPQRAGFPYSALITAFLTYLTFHEVLSLIFSVLLLPYRARLEALPALTVMRLELLLQLVFYVPIVLVPLWVLRRRTSFDPITGHSITLRSMLASLGYRTRNPLQDVLSGLFGYLLSMPLVVLTSVLSQWLFRRYLTPANPAELWMMIAQTPMDRLLVVLVASAGAPFVEEVMFRGILYPALRSKIGVWGGAFLSAAIFSAIHPTLPGGFLQIMAIGFGLALVYEWRRSLLPGIVLHGVFNGVITWIAFATFSR